MLRRTFYERFIQISMGAVTLALALPGLAYLLIPGRREREGTGWVDAGSVLKIPVGHPVQLRVRRERTDAWETTVEESATWVVRRPEGVTAFGPSCPHLGCGYKWLPEEDVFLCPCHDSRFSVDGAVLTGPSPRPLDRYDVRIEGDRLWLGEIRQVRENGEA